MMMIGCEDLNEVKEATQQEKDIKIFNSYEGLRDASIVLDTFAIVYAGYMNRSVCLAVSKTPDMTGGNFKLVTASQSSTSYYSSYQYLIDSLEKNTTYYYRYYRKDDFGGEAFSDECKSFTTANISFSLNDAAVEWNSNNANLTLSAQLNGIETIKVSTDNSYGIYSHSQYVTFVVENSNGEGVLSHPVGYNDNSPLQNGTISSFTNLYNFSYYRQALTYYAVLNINGIEKKTEKKTFTLTPPTTTITLNEPDLNGSYLRFSATPGDASLINSINLYVKDQTGYIADDYMYSYNDSYTCDISKYYLTHGTTYSYYVVATTNYGEQITSETKTFTYE